MTYQVILTSKAQLQLSSAALWWSEHRSEEQAFRWLDGFEAAINTLSEQPVRHGLAPENGFRQLPYPVRELFYGLGRKPTHRAVFEVRGETVYVLAIRHLAQDYLTDVELGQ